MNTVHTLREYVDALRDAGILVESTVSDELAAREIHCLTYDTRALSEDALFICKGAHFKEEYLCDALSRGAIAYVAEKKHNVDAPCLLVNDIRYSLVVLGQLFYNHVTDKLTSVGITGTKGKSTTAYYVRYILNDWLRAQSMPECAILSSIDNYDGKSTEESHITTPEVLELYQHFENAYECGISHLVMEASSQALKYGRVRGITYDVAAFLNIGSDHISPIEHPDFEDYFNSKLKIFDSCRFGCVNTDAKYSDRVIEYAKDRCNLITFGSHESAGMWKNAATGSTSRFPRPSTTVNFPSRCPAFSTSPTPSLPWPSVWCSTCRRSMCARAFARRAPRAACRSTRAATRTSPSSSTTRTTA